MTEGALDGIQGLMLPSDGARPAGDHWIAEAWPA